LLPVWNWSSSVFPADPLSGFQDEWKDLVKRFIDLAISLALLPALLVVTAGIAIAIKLDSSGPVFFIQQRVGLNKRLFPMYKFRTMFTGSDRRLKEIEHLNEAEGPIFKIANDPRITRAGKILRRTSLDELPQLFNVIRGEMSLVGPRPMSIRDVDLFDKGIQRKRFSVKPGITCLWQVSGAACSFSKWLELDLYYIANWSLDGFQNPVEDHPGRGARNRSGSSRSGDGRDAAHDQVRRERRWGTHLPAVSRALNRARLFRRASLTGSGKSASAAWDACIGRRSDSSSSACAAAGTGSFPKGSADAIRPSP
jgi:lipopolysaccharide/colanic/teichoic acid biosynthesis glycosyltransferase